MRLQLYNMLQLLVVALLTTGALASEAEPAKMAAEPAPEAAQTQDAKNVMKDSESAPLLYNHHYDDDHGNNHIYLKAKLDGPEGPRDGPLVARNLQPITGHGPNIAAQDEIIKFTYSPAYYEPMWVLDYRFLKSGGRRYTRGPGGQVLILPRSYKHYKGDGTDDYDQLVEYWRLKLIADQNKRMRENGFAHVHDTGHHENEHDRRQGHGEHFHGNIHHVNHMNMGREGVYRDRENMHHGRENIHREREHLHHEREQLHRYH